jgi:hypothetical protein
VTEELGAADADADVLVLVLELALVDAAGGVELLLPPLLQAASPVTAATAAMPPRAIRARGRLDCLLPSDVIGLILGNSFVLLISLNC